MERKKFFCCCVFRNVEMLKCCIALRCRVLSLVSSCPKTARGKTRQPSQDKNTTTKTTKKIVLKRNKKQKKTEYRKANARPKKKQGKARQDKTRKGRARPVSFFLSLFLCQMFDLFCFSIAVLFWQWWDVSFSYQHLSFSAFICTYQIPPE